MAKRKQRRATWKWEVALDSIAQAADPILLGELSKEIGKSIDRAQEATSKGSAQDPSDSDSLAEFEHERIEGLLGMSFIACQLDITGVVSKCLALYAKDGEDGLANKPKARDLKKDLMNRCNPTVAGKSYAQVAGIEAFANYFKHVDEWASELD